MNCPACGHENRDQARFCEQCGGRLAETAHGPATPARTVDPQRRQVTVLFADLVDSTALAESVEPEEFQALMREYHRLCAEEIERSGGQVAQYLGDGVLAYFGHPVALENDAQRAVQSGLAITHVMSQRPQRPALAARVGIHSGLVVTEESAAGDIGQLSVGGTLNIAARLQAIAAPNGVVISGDTHRLVQGFFESENLGRRTLKGLSAPIEVYEVRRETGAQSRVEAALGKLTPLLGRDREVEILLDRWHRVRAGSGQMVLIEGEAGIGKSRLLQELKQRIAEGGAVRLECRCAPHREHSALYPVINLLERTWELNRVASSRAKLERLERVVQAYADVVDVLPLLATLLSIPLPEGRTPLDLNPQAQRQKTLEALLAILSRIAAETPLLFAVEDVHWIDPSTLDFLNLLVEHVPTRRIFVVLLTRPGFAAPWPEGERCTRLQLSRLPADLTTAMIELVAGGKTLPTAVLQGLRERADGVPLYIEELTKMVLESGQLRRADGSEPTGRMISPAIPATLQESLIARLDHLAPVKEVVQLGAVIGRAFSYEVMGAVWAHDEATLRAELARLVAAEVLFERGSAPNTVYLFKHALIQDAAYESLVKSKRREYHQRIAHVLEERFKDSAETQPEVLAHHWQHAGCPAEAIRYYYRAGQRAIEASANLEATSHLGAALELIESLPADKERARLELEIRVTLGPALLAIKGYSIEEVEQGYARAHALCDEIGESTKLFYDALTGLFLFHQARGELETALQLTDKRLALAQELGDPTLVTQVYENRGTVAFWRGDFAEARERLGEALARYDPERARTIALIYGTDSAVVCNAYAASALWFLGLPEEAQRRSAESVARARELHHANSLGIALGFAASLQHFLRDGAAAQQLAEECIAVSTEHQLPLWLTMGKIFRGWALAEQGHADEGVQQMFDAVSGYQGMGMGLGSRLCVAILAQALLQAGRCDEGLAILEGGLAMVSQCEDRFCDAEIHRAKGEFLLGVAQPDPANAQRCFLTALDLARSQGSPSLELRAAMSLARFWRDRGERARARALLAHAHGRFSEGHRTRDMVEASALLSELAAGGRL